MNNRPPLTVCLAFLALVIIWSSTPLAVVLSLRDLDAIWSLSIRMWLAVIIAHGVLRMSGGRLGTSHTELANYGIGSLSMAVAMFFTYMGARHLPSGLISILFGASPLMVGLLGVTLVPGTRLLPSQWIGMVLGLIGLVCMFWRPEHASQIDARSVVLVLLGVLSYALASIWMRRRPALPPLQQTTGALWASALLCLAVIPLAAGHAPTHLPGMVSLSALLFSATLGSVVAMLCFFYLLRKVAASTVALTTLINPVIALGLGMVINHERFEQGAATGMLLIFAGLMLYYSRELDGLLVRRSPPSAALVR